MPTPACALCTGPEDFSLEYTLESTAENDEQHNKKRRRRQSSSMSH